jgi:Protein of unknown function (DUF3307).
MNEYIILIKLICAHFCSDFLLQNNVINNGKKKQGKKSLPYQILHSFIHALVAYLFVFQWSNWIIPIVIFISHFLIDLIKYKYKSNNLYIFLLDQFCHLAVIFVLWFFLYGDSETFFPKIISLNSIKFWGIVTAYVLMLKPASILLSLFLKQWTPSGEMLKSLPNAGKWIGYLERTLILTFILINCIEGVGFLLAAKSVFRFGELSKANEIKTTEYVLIGTLSSFTIAIVISYITKILFI